LAREPELTVPLVRSSGKSGEPRKASGSTFHACRLYQKVETTAANPVLRLVHTDEKAPISSDVSSRTHYFQFSLHH
jgi:hypothetical protein